jgi:hypothetical protein
VTASPTITVDPFALSAEKKAASTGSTLDVIIGLILAAIALGGLVTVLFNVKRT